MKKLSLVLCGCAFVAVFSFVWNDLKPKQTPIDIANVDSIVIYPGGKLSDLKAKEFVMSWNNAKPLGPTKLLAYFKLLVYMKNGEPRYFRANKGKAKEDGDAAFLIGPEGYFEALSQSTK